MLRTKVVVSHPNCGNAFDKFFRITGDVVRKTFRTGMGLAMLRALWRPMAAESSLRRRYRVGQGGSGVKIEPPRGNV